MYFMLCWPSHIAMVYQFKFTKLIMSISFQCIICRIMECELTAAAPLMVIPSLVVNIKWCYWFLWAGSRRCCLVKNFLLFWDFWNGLWGLNGGKGTVSPQKYIVASLIQPYMQKAGFWKFLQQWIVFYCCLSAPVYRDFLWL